jgi:hypothetical protein
VAVLPLPVANAVEPQPDAVAVLPLPLASAKEPPDAPHVAVPDW